MTYPTNKLSDNFFATISSRASQLSASGADVIRLDIGSPDLPPAPHIIETLSNSASRSDTHGYQSHRGPQALREAWVEMYQRVHGVVLDPDGLIPLLGSKEGVFHLSLALLNPGDIALVPDPGYQTYAAGAIFAGAEPIGVPLLPENGFLPDLEAIPQKTCERAKILWLNYPNNPTAAVASLAFFAQAVDFCRQHNIVLCHDAAYTQVTFDGYRAPSVLEVPGAAEVAIEFNTLSKSHNMAGWRIGVAAGQTRALAALFKLKTHTDSGQFLPIMEAATAALTGDQSWLEERNQIYADRREVVVSALKEMDLCPQEPRASLYVWCPLPEGWTSSSDFVLTLLDQAYVSLAPGTVFGPRGEGFVRISLVQPLARLTQAMDRMNTWIGDSVKVASHSPLPALR
jgi:LL-diaminopimelate aminotransferase